MTSEDRSEVGLRSAGKLVDKLCMQTTHSYVEAHRNITPRSNRVNTEPTAIDPVIYNIIASRSPNATRIRRLLPSSRPVAKKSTGKLETEVFQRAYSRQRQRVLTQVQGEEDRKRKLREKLGLGRKELPSFYKFDRDKLNYMEQRMAPQQGRYHQKLHPVCRLYQEYSERVSLRPHCLENPFERIT